MTTCTWPTSFQPANEKTLVCFVLPIYNNKETCILKDVKWNCSFNIVCEFIGNKGHGLY